MRFLRIIEHVSLDGVIEISTGDSAAGAFSYGDWTAAYRTPEGLLRVLDLYGEEFDVVLGRRTYDLWAAYWPNAPASPMSIRLMRATKHVATHRPDSLHWGPARSLGEDLLAGISVLRATAGPPLICAGSASLTSPLLQRGHVDELVQLVNPVYLGTGKRLMEAGAPAQRFRLLSSEALPSGILINRYLPQGALQARET